MNEGLVKTQNHHAARNDLKLTDFWKKQKYRQLFLMKNKDFKKDYEDLLNSKVDTLKCFS